MGCLRWLLLPGHQSADMRTDAVQPFQTRTVHSLTALDTTLDNSWRTKSATPLLSLVSSLTVLARARVRRCCLTSRVRSACTSSASSVGMRDERAQWTQCSCPPDVRKVLPDGGPHGVENDLCMHDHVPSGSTAPTLGRGHHQVCAGMSQRHGPTSLPRGARCNLSRCIMLACHTSADHSRQQAV